MKTWIFSNEKQNATFDCFTIIREDGEMWGSSHHPFAPNGFGQHVGNIADNYWNVAYGYSWRRVFGKRVKRMLKQTTQDQLNIARGDKEWLGEEVQLEDLPTEVQKFIKQIEND
jgi:hypothetical protein